MSEVVTNALLHGRTQAELTVRLEEGKLRVEVADGNPKQPVRKYYAEDAGTGRGIGIVEELASAWGVEGHRGGKKVWFELMDSRCPPMDVVSEPRAEDRDVTSADHGDGSGGVAHYRPQSRAGRSSYRDQGRPKPTACGMYQHRLADR